MTTIKKCHELVLQHRSQLESVWPTPPPIHALMFALSEVGEMFDAHMRTFPEYKRNNDRDNDVLDEAADVAMMLLTATDKLYLDESINPNMVGDKFILVAQRVTYALRCCEDNYMAAAYRSIVDALLVIESMPGMDLYARLEAKLKQTMEKFG